MICVMVVGFRLLNNNVQMTPLKLRSEIRHKHLNMYKIHSHTHIYTHTHVVINYHFWYLVCNSTAKRAMSPDSDFSRSSSATGSKYFNWQTLATSFLICIFISAITKCVHYTKQHFVNDESLCVADSLGKLLL
jgi:hypothetical protein